MHWHHDAEVGHLFRWEERACLSYFKVLDGVEYRKRSRKEQYLEKVAEAWGLTEFDVAQGHSGTDWSTTVFSSPLLVAWMFAKARHFRKGA